MLIPQIKRKANFIKGLACMGLIIFSLVACGGGGGGGGSSSAPADTAAPSVPGNLAANAVSSGQIDLSWSAATDNTGVAGYKIYRDGSYLKTVTSTSSSDTGLVKNTNYCYKVSAEDAAGNESGQSSEACATTLDSGTKQWGSAANDETRGLVIDGSGNIYVTGATYGSIDSQANAGDWDAFLTKYDSLGTRQWTKYIGTAGTDWGQAVAVDGSGNIYITGSVSGSFAGMTYTGGKDVFLAKFDPSGNRIGFTQWGTSNDNFGYGVTLDGSGNVFVTGPTDDDLDGQTNAGVRDVFLSKFDSSLNKQWTKLLGTNNNEYVNGIATDGSGNIYLAGFTWGEFPGNTRIGAYDIFLAKYDPSGTQQWVKQWGSASDDEGRGIAVDSVNNIYITGKVNGDVDGVSSLGGQDIFLTKYDSAGTQQWTKLFGTANDDAAYGLALDANDNIYLTGETSGDLGGNPNAGGPADVFLIKCDSAGNQLWSRVLGSSADDVGTGVAVNDNNGYIYAIGNTFGNFDGNLNAGGSDLFLLTYDSSGTKQ